MSSAVLVNGIAGQVGKKVFTVRDAYFYRSLDRFVSGQKPALLLEEGDALKKTVQKIVFEEMLYQELQGFQFEGVSKSDSAKRVNSEKAKGREKEWAALLKRFGKTEAEAIEKLYQISLTEKFLQKKVDTLAPIITDTEVERYVKQNEARFKKSHWEDLKPQIVAILKKERTEKGLQDWIQFLTEKYSAATYID